MLFLGHNTDYTVLIEELSKFYLYFDFIAYQNQTYCINVPSLHLQM
jgi:phosphate starvation-inducible membrane PsiE